MWRSVVGVVATALISRVAGGGLRPAAAVPASSPGPVAAAPNPFGTASASRTRLTRTRCCGESMEGGDAEGSGSAKREANGSASAGAGKSPRREVAGLEGCGVGNSLRRTAKGTASGDADPVKPSASTAAPRASRRARTGNSRPSHSVLYATPACTAAASTSPGDLAARRKRRLANPAWLTGRPQPPVEENNRSCHRTRRSCAPRRLSRRE
jgi:hypothetical protein